MGVDELKVIAAELVLNGRRSVTIDWTIRESARAKAAGSGSPVRRYGAICCKARAIEYSSLPNSNLPTSCWIVSRSFPVSSFQTLRTASAMPSRKSSLVASNRWTSQRRTKRSVSLWRLLVLNPTTVRSDTDASARKSPRSKRRRPQTGRDDLGAMFRLEGVSGPSRALRSASRRCSLT